MSEKINLRREILSGTFWSGSGQVSTALTRFVIMLVLARLLLPDFFGLLGISMVVMLILRDISDMGFGAALVQREQIDEVDLSTVFWFNLFVSLFMAGLLIFGAKFLAQLLGDARLEPILVALAVCLPINALSSVPQAMLLRNLRFAQIAWRDLVGTIGFGLVGIPLALADAGSWSLIAAFAAQWIFRSGYVYLAFPYRPIFVFDRNRLRSLFKFSFGMFISMLMARFVENIDYFLIGRFLGAGALGYYTLAFQLVIIPIQRITGILGNVLFPAFAKIQSQMLRLQNGFLQSIKILAWILLPISAFLFISADVLVTLLYTDKWSAVIPVVRLLSLASFFYALDITNSVMNAIGKPVWRSVIFGSRAALFIFLFWRWGVSTGIERVALYMLIAVTLSAVLQGLILLYELKISLSKLGSLFLHPILGITIATLLTYWIKVTLSIQYQVVELAILTLVFGTVYLMITIPTYYQEIRRLLLSFVYNRLNSKQLY